MAVLLAGATAVAAEESFYPIVGADGSIQIIRSSGQSAKKPTAEKKRSKPESRTQPGDAASASVSVEPVAPKGQETSEELTAAPYDSDVYLDSEVLDQHAASPARGKSRFYVIQDGMGAQVSQEPSDGEAEPEPLAKPKPKLAVPSFPVDVKRVVLKGEDAVKRFPALSSCLTDEQRTKSQPIRQGTPASLVLDRQLQSFLDESRVIAAYRLDGEGMRTLVPSSYSRKDKRPAFVHPYLALYGADGCLTRVLGNYYERFYPATDSRHPMLRSSLTIHTEESYMLVMIPRDNDLVPASDLPYGYASQGQLKFTLKK